MILRVLKKSSRFWLPLLFIALLVSPFQLEAKKKAYSVEFEGIYNILQLRSLKDASNLIRYKKTPPRSMAALRYRAQSDIPEFLDVLRSYGYYDACVTTKVIKTEKKKYLVVVSIEKGTQYSIKSFDLNNLHEGDDSFDLASVSLSHLDIKIGRAARSDTIVDAKKSLLKIMNRQGFPFADVTSEEILVDQAQKNVAVDLEVESGPKAYFGPVTIVCDSSVHQRYIRNRIQWKEGDLYNFTEVQRTEKKLYDTGIFATVTIHHAEKLEENSTLPMTITLTDAKHDSFTIGGSFTPTWEYLGGAASWEIRNLINSGTNLQLDYSINQKVQEGGIKYTVPDFLSKNQAFVIKSEALSNKQPYFTEKAVKTTLYVERYFGRHFSASLGTKFDFIKTEDTPPDTSKVTYYSLLGIPLHANYESADNLLINPTQGGWCTFKIAPYLGLAENTKDFGEVMIEASVYQYLIPSKRIILALNGVFGSLFGQDQANIPAPFKYFAGSPHHLRGYPYQKVSPLDFRNEPIGGRSILLASVEPRFVVFKPLEIVGFLDIGNVYRQQWPQWDTAMLKSLGVGVRYFSLVGPLRLDIGFPMNKRPNVKMKPQIYFAFGQAF